MRAVFGLVLVLGMALAAFAVYMVQDFMSEQDRNLARARAANAAIVPTTKVLAPLRTLQYGETITEADVHLIDYAVEYLPVGAIASIEDLMPSGPTKPRMTVRQLDINEPITAAKVTLPGESAGISSLLEPGQRAFTINVNVATGVSGFLRPGDYVDVYWTGTIRDENGGRAQSVTQLIRTSIEIIAVDQVSDTNLSGALVARTVTVQVSPQDVAALAQAQTTGRLSLALVGAGDESVLEEILFDQKKLLGLVEAESVSVTEEICTIRTRRGAEVLEIPIPCPNQ